MFKVPLNRQVLETKTLDLIVTTTASSVEEATTMIFKQINKQIYQKIEALIVQMETEAFYYQDIHEIEAKKSMLPNIGNKKTKKLSVTAKVVLKVKYIEIERGNIE